MKKWLANLQPRERRVLGFGLVSLVVLGGYIFLLEPLIEQREQLLTRVAVQKKLKVHLGRVAQEAKTLRFKAESAIKLSGTGGDTLLAVVSNTSRKSGIKKSMKRIAPEGSSKARIWLEEASFDQLITWVTSISSAYMVNVDSINITADDVPGQVRAKLTLVTSE